IKKAGYQASTKSAERSEEDKKLRTASPVKRRLVLSFIILFFLMYISMGHNMWALPLPRVLEKSPLMLALFQFVLCALIMVINRKFFINGFSGLLKGAPNMDTLVSLGSASGFIYSIALLFNIYGATRLGNIEKAASLLHGLYFEPSAMVLVIITLGKLLEGYSKNKTVNAIKSLMDLSPKTANVIVDGEEKILKIEEVKVGDIFVVRPGESIPLDATVIEGESAVDESLLTGESIPLDKGVGASVYSGTINQSGFLKCKVSKAHEESTISQIIKMVSDASSTKPPIAKIADKVSGIFVPTVMIIAIITTVSWFIFGQELGFALEKGISVLVISCPCALGIATPVSIMVASGLGARNGLLFKNAPALEELAKVKIIALDKTGTITKGEPVVTDIITCDGISEEELLLISASLECKSEHPLAKAILKKTEEKAISPKEVSDFKSISGNGLTAIYEEKQLFGGKI
ncbi:MAG: heavy metal translocating P-type ATPase, partial [Clostridia bacterium]|nr:heavy metal translocating P-type ATPase [Clostridia bacterium]